MRNHETVERAVTAPRHPIEAVTHPDPYPYYADLVHRSPLYRDVALDMWVACSAAAVRAVLTAPACRVRPSTEPVPRAIAGRPAGDIFSRLVRQNDGAGHQPMKQAVAATLESLAPGPAADLAQQRARAIAEQLELARHPQRLTEFAFRLPVQVVGCLLGVPPLGLAHLERWVAHLAGGFGPAAASEHVEQAHGAAEQLLGLFDDLLAEPELARPDGLLGTLAHEAQRAHGADRRTLLANGIGFLTQAYEATAGLTGNTLVALAARPDLARRARAEPAILADIAREVARFDPPIQNTRRFLAEDARVGGTDMRAGDTVLVVLASANRDPAANPGPHAFDPFRPGRISFTFGIGPHGCPGEALAVAIAAAGVTTVLGLGLDLSACAAGLHYRPSANARVPLLGQASPTPSTGGS